ncbi:glycoside hydrolase family 43 protein [uncultured Sphaerochaeta sp.]|uniref:glycoside hydrolase family 43 protein n=1 Tax=uncultured Sphaerochaeta sp. TaxID=886478 RepID=UPI002A0A2253|nr:glycoside hydrolase family 43 protein [uncultured Sphaerochaeta sp.]
MLTIKNPILRGFHPDPSAIRVGDTYYVATSTFEWYPGIEIHSSLDLANWQVVSRPLCHLSQLDMRGEEPSCGIWAPNLSWHEGLFYLVYTDMKSYVSKDLHNYLVTSPSIEGPWSEPIFLNSTGFDPSLFHEEDGKKYLVNLNWDYRKKGHDKFGFIQIQEYDAKQKRLVEKPRMIYPHDGLREGSTIYKRAGFYYLMIAYGGTGTEHSAVVSRSTSLFGPYVDDPQGYLLTSKFDKEYPLQKAGHASLFDTPQGNWYAMHLCSRPLPGCNRSTLGRETALQQLVWEPGEYPRLQSGGILPSLEVETLAPDQRSASGQTTETIQDFSADTLPFDLLTLRSPLEPWQYSLKKRSGWLRLYGYESLHSRFRQSLVAQKVTDFCFESTVKLEGNPTDFHQVAGMVCLYNQDNYLYLCLGFDEQAGRCLKLAECRNKEYREMAITGVEAQTIGLRLVVNFDQMQGYWKTKEEDDWMKLGPSLDASFLSDEAVEGAGYTGMMIGLCAQDLTGSGMYADFTQFSYKTEGMQR